MTTKKKAASPVRAAARRPAVKTSTTAKQLRSVLQDNHARILRSVNAMLKKNGIDSHVKHLVFHPGPAPALGVGGCRLLPNGQICCGDEC